MSLRWVWLPRQERSYTLHERSQGVAGLLFLPDGDHVASPGGDFNVKLWEVRNGQGAGSPKARRVRAYDMAFSRDGTPPAMGNLDSTIGLRELESGQAARALGGRGALVMSVALSLDGTLLASGGYDISAYQWGSPHPEE